MDLPRLLRDARLARREFGSEFRILCKYESACKAIVEQIPDFDLDIDEIGDVGKTWLWAYEREDDCARKRKLLGFWRELTEILCKLLVREAKKSHHPLVTFHKSMIAHST